MTTKPALQSKTIRGSISEIIAVAALVAAFFGYDIDGDTQATLANSMDDISVAVFAVWSAINNVIIIWGRLTASKSLTYNGKMDVPAK